MFAPDSARKPATAATMPWRSGQVMSRRPFMRSRRLLRPGRPTRPPPAGGGRRAGAARRRRGAGRSPVDRAQLEPVEPVGARAAARASRRGRRRSRRGWPAGRARPSTSRVSKPAARARAGDQVVPARARSSAPSASALSGTASQRGEPVAGRQRDQERLGQQVAPLDALVLAAFERRVLEPEREVQLAAGHALGELGRRALLEQHLARSRAAALRHQPDQRAGKRADPQPRRRVASSASCARRELEALGDRVRVGRAGPRRRV